MPSFEKLAAAATIARGLAMDAVEACASGHLGLPLGRRRLAPCFLASYFVTGTRGYYSMNEAPMDKVG